MADNTRTAVIVEDDAEIRDLSRTVLGQAGFITEAAATGVEGVELVRRTDPVVTTLDVSSPDIDGFEVCRRIRQISDTYIVMLTARTDEIDTLMGSDAGADDYQTKPFRPRESRARIEALSRRPRRGSPSDGADAARPAPADHEPTLVGSDGLSSDVPRRTATVDGEAVHLTRSEYDLSGALVEAAGRVVSRNELVRVSWGEEYDAGTYVTDADRRSVEVHIANSRRKLGDGPSSPRWIRTQRHLVARAARGGPQRRERARLVRGRAVPGAVPVEHRGGGVADLRGPDHERRRPHREQRAARLLVVAPGERDRRRVDPRDDEVPVRDEEAPDRSHVAVQVVRERRPCSAQVLPHVRGPWWRPGTPRPGAVGRRLDDVDRVAVGEQGGHECLVLVGPAASAQRNLRICSRS
ncbi:hypothetical protein OY671_004469 [Metschnikowia pulcherrima]|nr:hypothetical protein OY671_004469 [Metschnikowia pulcherrima]